jgi:hypothetical protein
MPILQITQAALAPEHARATFEYLLAVMLWPRPTDQDCRDAFLRTCDVARRADLAAAAPSTFAPNDLAASLRDALFARAPADWHAEIESRIHRGMLVGIYFAGCWNRAVSSERVSVKQLHGLMTAPKWRAQHPAADIGPKTLEAAIREFRQAGPLWAAAFICGKELDEPFPPRTSDGIIHLLAVAEDVRRVAASTSLQGRKEPLLPEAVDAWRPPTCLQLPEAKFVQGP